MLDEATKKTLLEVADDYERLAGHIEVIEAQMKNTSRRLGDSCYLAAR
jgi:hypothetical protein